ncbi:MAG: CehA/McbA family metallohydrolase [Polyangiales bacterium]
MARLRSPIKVSLGERAPKAPDSAMGELEGERERFGLQRVIYSVTGQERVRVKPGRYRAAVSRGAEFEVETVDVEVPADGEATLTATLTRSVDTTGYVAADFHQHTVGSIDSPRSLCGRVVEDIAEGLEWASTTDHDNVTDFMPCVRELSLERWFNATQGNEISVVGTGHFNAYPMPVGGADPFRAVGAQYWADLSAQALFDRIRAEPTDPILHISHPRSTGLKGYFTSIALDPFSLTGRQPLATGFEAIEVNTEVGDPADYLASNDAAARMAAMRDPSSVPTLRDWFSMLNRGDHTCALGNSDTHGRNDGSGWPHNLVRVGEDRPDRVDIAAIRTAIRAQRVVVASGLTVRVRVNGQERMGHTEVVTPTAGAVELDVEVQAPSWVDARTLVLFENGRPLALTDAGGGVFDARVATERTDPFTLALGMDSPGRAGAVRFRARVRVRPTRDSHYVALARGGPLSPVGSGDAISYTNPVYVDVDGGGVEADALSGGWPRARMRVYGRGRRSWRTSVARPPPALGPCSRASSRSSVSSASGGWGRSTRRRTDGPAAASPSRCCTPSS